MVGVNGHPAAGVASDGRYDLDKPEANIYLTSWPRTHNIGTI